MKKSRSVQSTLQIAFFSIIIIIFTLYMSYYVIVESRKLDKQAFNTVKQNVTTASSFVDTGLNSLDTVMQNIAYSNLVKEQYAVYLNDPISTDNGNYTSMQNSKILTNLLTAIIGPNRPVDQIYLYALDRGSFGIGLDNATSDIAVSDFDWYDSLINGEKNKIVFCSKDSRLDKYFSYEDGSRFLTLCSVYQSNKYKPNGVIEVKRSISPLIKQLETIDTATYNQNLYIFDPSGVPVYYTTGSAEASQKYSFASDFISDISFDSAETFKGDKENLFLIKSSYSGFTTLISVTDKDLRSPLVKFIKDNLVIFAAIAVLTYFISYFVSRIITNPLMKMYSQLQSLHTTGNATVTDESIASVDTNIIELDTLYSAVIDMHERAQKSMKREMELHNQELQTRMLALQSQMNPHFLYNSLATIQSMADEHMDDEVIDMCQTISRILRYISSNNEQLVPIEQDLEHACDYLSCMKMRYEEDLSWNIDIPEEMMGIPIPKLCLQLIIENSIKYSTKSVRPPWIIKIKGHMTSTYWELSIADNGLGFDEEEIKSLNEKINYINETNLLPSLEINGMGLMNIYIRFKIMYNGNHIFRLSNLADGGAIVTIGGDIPEEMV